MTPGALLGRALRCAYHHATLLAHGPRGARDREGVEHHARELAQAAGAAAGTAFRAAEEAYERGRREERERIVRRLKRDAVIGYRVGETSYGNILSSLASELERGDL